MLETVKQALRQSSREVIIECRRCGANVDSSDESCPVCDSAEIAEYELDS